MDIKNKNELKRRIDLFLHDFTSEEYKINEEFCKETMRLMADFIGHVNCRMDSMNKKIIDRQREIKGLKEDATNGCTGICRAKSIKDKDAEEWYIGEVVCIDDKVYMLWDGANVEDSKMVFDQWIQVVPETVQRYTGMEDMIGNKLFEGDIIQIPEHRSLRMEICYGKYGAFCPNDQQYMENVGFFVVSNATEDAMPLGPTKEYALLLGNAIDNPDIKVV